MNDEPDEALDPHPDEGQDVHIRALLAELGSGPDGRPMPPEVAARLDDTLARLVAERASTSEEHEDGSGAVVPLRRRWVPRATAAAAAIVVLGAGGVAAANLGILGNDRPMSSDSGAGSASERKPEAPPATDTSPTPSGAARETTGGAIALPEISASSFASDVSALLQRRTSLVTPDKVAQPGTDSSLGKDTTDEAKQRAANSMRVRNCPGPKITEGGVPNPVRYDGRLAVLVVHPERDGRQLVEAWTCAGDRRLAGTTITP